MIAMLNPLLTAALRYGELGYPVFPCLPGGKAPLTEHGHLDATTDSEQIVRWWADHPTANIAIATERLVVVDIDGAANPWLVDNVDRYLELSCCPVASTPHGGSHRVFRQPDGKQWRCSEGRLARNVDIRATGGYIVVAPSVIDSGCYEWVPGLELDEPPDRLPEPPVWLREELDRLAACSPTLACVTSSPADANVIPSGQRNSTLASLAGAMRRHGMSHAEILAALVQANADRCTPPMGHREVERIALSISRYEPDSISVALAENHWGQMFRGEALAAATEPCDPGPVPDELLHMPGFVGEVMDHCLATAPYPNPALAFCGALALQAVLAGRKVRDEGDNRTNLYVLALGYSSVGKDWPRKINTHILHQVGMGLSLGDKFASGEGIQDALFLSPAMLFQTDEIDGLLQSINKAHDARHENILGTLLTMYSAANSIYPMRRKAGKEPPGVIDQPGLVVYGTAIPTHYYAALSQRMLTNGFFARMLTIEAGRRGAGQEPGIIQPPERVMERAEWWAAYSPGTGNLEHFHPQPTVVEADAEGRRLLVVAREAAEHEYAKAEAAGDAVGTTVWGRVPEQIRKLALLYAVSADHTARIDTAAVRWATDFMLHQTRRMLFMAQSHVAENNFHAECLRLLRKLREAPHGLLSHSILLKRLKIDAKSFATIVETLRQQGEVEIVSESRAGWASRSYRLAEGESCPKGET